jgi:hypothetical protein
VTVWNNQSVVSQDPKTNPTNNQLPRITERLYSVPALAVILAPLSKDTIRRQFIDEPGVIVIQKRRKGTRIYRTLLVPESVLQRKLKQLTVGGAL